MTALIIGASGFIGRHLVAELHRRGIPVAGTYWRAADKTSPPAYPLDILEPEKVRNLLQEVRPEIVFHLAAESVPARAWGHPQACYRLNLEGTANVADACLTLSPPPILVFPSSSHVYGASPPADRGLRETDPCLPVSPYGIAKWAAERHLSALAQRRGLRTVVFRLFNQFGPGQRGPFFVSEMAEAIVGAERTTDHGPRTTGPKDPETQRPRDPETGRPQDHSPLTTHPLPHSHTPTLLLRTGNLQLRRDFLDVRDAVKALALVTEPKRAAAMLGKTYNLGRGEPIRLVDILDILLAESRVPITPETDPAKLRPGDPPVVYADISEIQKDTGWRPERVLEDSLREVMEEMRSGEG